MRLRAVTRPSRGALPGRRSNIGIASTDLRRMPDRAGRSGTLVVGPVRLAIDAARVAPVARARARESNESSSQKQIPSVLLRALKLASTACCQRVTQGHDGVATSSARSEARAPRRSHTAQNAVPRATSLAALLDTVATSQRKRNFRSSSSVKNPLRVLFFESYNCNQRPAERSHGKPEIE